MSNNNIIYLLDGTALAYRSYFAFTGRFLYNSKGENTSAVYGFVRTLFKLINDFKIEYLVISFDKSHKTFRHKIYKNYKATREKMPDEMRASLKYLYDVCEALNISYIEMDDYEADDIVATIAKKSTEKGLFDKAYIVTRDKDLYQLVNEKIFLIDVFQDLKLINKDEVLKKFGIPPNLIVDYLALIGDRSDNIPGVPGIGDKRARELVNTFGTIENIYNNLDKIKPEKIRKALEEHKEEAFFSKSLIKLNLDVPVDIEPIDKFKIKPPKREKWIELLKRLEFYSLLKEFLLEEEEIKKEEGDQLSLFSFSSGESKKEEKKEKKDHSYKLGNLSDLEYIEKKAKELGYICIDTETSNLDIINPTIVGVSIALDEGTGFYFNISHYDNRGKIDIKYIIDLFERLKKDNILFIGHNIKYDFEVLTEYGFDYNYDNIFDTMIASWILDPDDNHYSLDHLVLKLFNHNMISITSLIGEKRRNRKQLSFEYVDLDSAVEYSVEDVDYTLRLYKFYKPFIDKEYKEVFYNIEMPLIKVLIDLEKNGVKIDIGFLKGLSAKYDKSLIELTEEIYKKVGEKFNINSSKQLGEILFEKLKLPVIKKTKKTKGYSTDEEVLEELSKDYEVPKLILEYRKIQKLKSTYIDGLPSMINPTTGRIHSIYNQTGTATGRLSSSNPNLQNIPVKTEEGKEIRKAFIGEGDNLIVSFDYSQIELRIIAHFSEDPYLIKAFLENIDVHKLTASKIYNKTIDEITDEERKLAKTINFGIIYGMQPYGLSKSLGIDVHEAKVFIDKYFENFPKVKEYIESIKEFAKTNKYVETLFGRRRYLKWIDSTNRNLREYSLRAAINSPIQGTAADIIKIAMNRVFDFLHKNNLKSKLIMQIHDELVFETPPEEKEIIIENVKGIMEGVVSLKVPLIVDWGVGRNWFDAH